MVEPWKRKNKSKLANETDLHLLVSTSNRKVRRAVKDTLRQFSCSLNQQMQGNDQYFRTCISRRQHKNSHTKNSCIDKITIFSANDPRNYDRSFRKAARERPDIVLSSSNTLHHKYNQLRFLFLLAYEIVISASPRHTHDNWMFRQLTVFKQETQVVTKQR